MVELDSEGEMTRHETATFLRSLADEIDDWESNSDVPEPDIEGEREPARMTVIMGGQSATLSLPETMEVDVEIESHSPMFSSNVNQEIEIELSWEVEELEADESIEVV